MRLYVSEILIFNVYNSLSPLIFYLKKTVEGGPGVEISIIKKI